MDRLTPEEMAKVLNITKYKPPLIYQVPYDKIAKAQAIATEAATLKRVVEAIKQVENPWTVTLYDALRHEGFESARQSILKEVGGLNEKSICR